MTRPPGSALRGPLFLMVGSSALLPVIGLLGAPILARGLGPDGRGLVSAAGAPGVLLVGLAALGLPEALTFYLAQHTTRPARLVIVALTISLLAGIIAVLGTLVVLPFLSSGNSQLAELIALSTWLAVPQLLIGVLRGASTGLQLWRRVAAEKIVSSSVRLITLLILYFAQMLTPLTAVLTISISAIVSGVSYLPLVALLREVRSASESRFTTPLELVGFGTRVWAGGIAGVVLSRIGQVLFVPLSNVSELGLFVVGITIADVPLLIAFAVRDALYGVSSRTRDAQQVGRASRVTLLLTAAICLTLGGSVGIWIGPVFGDEFKAATVPTWLFMTGALIGVPGYVVAAGIGAWGKPGARSVGLVLTLCIYLVGFTVLVPSLGAIGAGVAGIASGGFSSIFMVIVASRALQLSWKVLIIPRRVDFAVFVEVPRLAFAGLRDFHRH